MTLKTKSVGGALALNGNGKLTCECCCSFDIPALEWQSRSASKSKVGFPEWPGFVGTPPKRYLRLDIDGTRRGRCDDQEDTTASMFWDVAQEYDPDDPSALPVLSGTWQVNGNTCSGSYPDPFENFGDGEFGSYFGATSATADCDGGVGACIEATVTIVSGTVMEAESRFLSDTITATLSSEDTTANLITRTQAAMPTDWPNTTAGSLRSLSTNELTYSERESEWRVTLPIDLVAGRSYRLFYVVRFTPDTGPAVDEPEDFIAISGDDAGDPIAWQPLAVPDDNGTNSVILVRWECGPFPP
jgi:hypothetical protein